MCRRREGKAKILAREGRCAIVPHQEILVREAPTTRTDRETEKETCHGMKKERENDVKRKERKRHDTQTPPPFFFSLRSTLRFTSCRVDLFLRSYRLRRSSLFIRHTREEKRRQVAARTLPIIASRKETECIFARAQSPIKVGRPRSHE